MNINKFIQFFSLLAFCFSLLAAQQANNSITIGETRTLRSSVLNEDRPLMVYLPPGYNQSTAKYPVLYLLDAETQFLHVSGIVEFLSRNNEAPPMIVVGVANTNRTRDLTPPTKVDTTLAGAGGGDVFLKFLETELIPYVEKNFRTDPYKILVGHSFGGLLAVHTFMTKTKLFNAYVSISPYLVWNDQYHSKHLQSFLAGNPSLKSFLYLTMGNEGGNMLSSIKEFTAILARNAPKELQWKFVHMEDETHGSIHHLTTYNAFSLLYNGWRLPNDLTTLGLEGLERHYKTVSEKYQYTVQVPEAPVNNLGYQYINQKKLAEALAAFRYNVKHYPESANVYDSLGEGYEANNQLDLAKQNYELAVKKAMAAKDPNLGIFQAHFDNVRKKLAN